MSSLPAATASQIGPHTAPHNWAMQTHASRLVGLKFLQLREIVAADPYASSEARQKVEADLRDAIAAVVWPPGSETFTIPPGTHLNGVLPIKNGFVTKLIDRGW